MKKCNKCGETKLRAGFHKQTQKKDGLQSLCKICVAADHREYRAINLDKARERGRKSNRRWIATNPDKARESERKYLVANLELVRQRGREYQRRRRVANPDIFRAADRRRHIAQPERARLGRLRRRARKKANGIFVVTDREIKSMLAKPCYLCGDAPSVHVDHIVPLVKGGRHSVGNLAGACAPCNLGKHAMLLIEFKRRHKA